MTFIWDEEMFQTYLVAFIGLVIAFVAMGAALHFSRYKRRGGCCSQRLDRPAQQVEHGCDVCSCAPPVC
jgi:hypothetical protein